MMALSIESHSRMVFPLLLCLMIRPAFGLIDFREESMIKHANLVLSVSFTQGGSSLVTTTWTEWPVDVPAPMPLWVHGLKRTSVIQMWDVSHMKKIRQTSRLGIAAWTSVRSSLDDQLLLAVAPGDNVEVYDSFNLHLISSLSADVVSAAMDPHSSKIAVGLKNGFIEIWDRSFKTKVASWRAGQSGIGDVKWTSSTNTLISSSWDGTCSGWDSVTWTKRFCIPVSRRGDNIRLAIAEDGDLVAATGFDQEPAVITFHSDKGDTVSEVKGYAGSLCFVNSGRDLAIGRSNGTIDIVSCSSWRRIRVLSGHGDEVLALDWSQKEGLMASGSRDCSVRLWRMEE